MHGIYAAAWPASISFGVLQKNAEIDGCIPSIELSTVELGAQKRTQLFDSCTSGSTASSRQLLELCLAERTMPAGIGSAASSLDKLVQRIS
jgi:hypothetical protein